MNEQDMWDRYFGLAASGHIAARNGESADLLDSKILARDCAEIADAMLAERRKRIKERAAEPHPDNERAVPLLRMVTNAVRPDLNDKERAILDDLADRLEGKQ